MATSRVLISLLLLSLCMPSLAFSGFGADVDNYIEEAAQRYQIPKAMLRGLVKMENGWKNNISPTGATGVGQFTFKTWNWLSTTDEGRMIGMKPISHRTRGTYADPRLNKRINTLATALYARWHIEQFVQRGIAVTDSNLYMAHNIGLDGFHRALLGRATADDLRNMRRNGMKRWMTVRDFIAYQKNRYNTHKQIANAFSPSPTSVTSNMPMMAKQSQNRINKMEMALQNISAPLPKAPVKRDKPALRWVQPSDKPMVWINPVQKL